MEKDVSLFAVNRYIRGGAFSDGIWRSRNVLIMFVLLERLIGSGLDGLHVVSLHCWRATVGDTCRIFLQIGIWHRKLSTTSAGCRRMAQVQGYYRWILNTLHHGLAHVLNDNLLARSRIRYSLLRARNAHLLGLVGYSISSRSYILLSSILLINLTVPLRLVPIQTLDEFLHCWHWVCTRIVAARHVLPAI